MLNCNFASITESDDHFLLEVTAKEENSPQTLMKWIEENRSIIREKVETYGGIFFKGFDINCAANFEFVAKSLEPHLSNRNPFDAIACTWHTEHTYEVASPLIKKSMRPLSFHNEDSFLPRIPSAIMFCAIEPAPWGGETFIVDSRKVYHSLPEHIKEKFTNKNIKSKLIIPTNVFLINSRIPKNKLAIEASAKSWGAEKITFLPNRMIQFDFTVPAVIKHRSSLVWFNVLHQVSLINDCINIWKAYFYYKNGFINKIRAVWLINVLILKSASFFIVNLFKKEKEKEKEMHSYELENGEKITLKDRIAINIAYWKNVVVLPLKKGDFVFLDNILVAHGRMPYRGKRLLLSCTGSHLNSESLHDS